MPRRLLSFGCCGSRSASPLRASFITQIPAAVIEPVGSRSTR
jgi:hypothetical protein